MRRALPLLLLLAPGTALAQYLPSPIPPDGSITPAKLAADAPADNECLTYDDATASFEWDTCGSGSGAPTDATYLTQTHHAGLSAEQAMGDLGTGLVKNATTTGVQSIYAGTSCTNQFPRSLDASGAATCASVADADLANNYSGVGACSSGAGVTATVDNAAPTCNAHVMFDDEANTLTQNLTLNDGTTNSPSLIFTPQTGATWTIFGEDTTGDLEIRTNSSSNTQMNLVNTGTGVSNITIDGDVLGSGTSSSSNHPGGGADDQVLVASSSTVSAWKTLPNGAVSYATSSNAFSQAGVSNLASSTSADLRGVLSDESGTGAALFAGATGVGLHRTLVTLGSDVASSASTSFQDVTGLSFSVTSGTNYRYYCILLYTTSDATIGLRVSVNAPSFTHNAYMVRTPITVSGSLTLVEFVNGASAVNTGTTSSGSMNTTGGNIAILEGIIRPSADGTLQVRFAPETATSNGVVIETGSTCEWW